MWPVRSGVTPPLANGFTTRPETAPGIETMLVPGVAVVLAPTEPTREWLGSCGKTQLAVFLVESLWQSVDVDLLVWISASSRAQVLSGYGRAAAAAGITAFGDAESVAGRFVGWLRETSRPWLVVLDDLRDVADLRGLWPEGPTGRVLITTATPVTQAGRQRTLVVPVGAFSHHEAVRYLMGRLGAGADQRHGAIELVEDLGREPLALAHAGAVIGNSPQSCGEYREEFARRRAQFASVVDGTLPAAAITWTLSFDRAEQVSPGAQYLLVLCALLDGHGIPATVLTTAAAREYLGGVGARRLADPKRAWDALLSLERAGLLTVNPTETPPVIRMNAMVQAAIQRVMPTEMLDRAVRTTAQALLEAWPDDDREAWLAEALRSAATSLKRSAGLRLWEKAPHPLLLRVGRSLEDARLVGPAIAYWSELASVSSRVLEPSDPGAQIAGDRLAAVQVAAGRAAEAIGWLQPVLAEKTRTLGPGHPATIEARLDLGRALVASGRTGDGVSVLGGAAADGERILGAAHLETLRARDQFAAACGATGRVAEAIELYRRTLAGREGTQGQRHPDTMMTRQRLAEAYLADDRIKEAVSAFKRTLTDRERALGSDHPDTITTRAALGSAYHSGGKMVSALRFCEQAHADSGRVLGADHPDTLERAASLAHVYYAVGRLTDATTLLRDTVARCDRVLPPADPLTRTVRESLANVAGG